MQKIIYKLWNTKNKKKKRITPEATKKTICILLVLAIMTLATPGITLARQGDSGYEGGISSGETPSTSKTTTSSKYEYQYQEPCFLSGVPIVLTGTLTITKKVKQDTKTNTQTLTSTFTYSLKNTDKASTLSRALTFVTTITPRDNGQKTESTQLTKAKETVALDGDTYYINSISDYEFSKSILNDIKPAVNYYLGTLQSVKTYHIGSSSDTIVVESDCNYSGYDEFWSSAEAQVLNQTISQCTPGQDPVGVGDVSINISATTQKKLTYNNNIPEQSSVQGGYIQTQQNENVLKYTAELNELDKNNKPTGKPVTYENSLKLNSSKTQESLVSPDLNQIKGHSSEQSIRLLFGLEAFKDAATFDPQEYMNRAEFIDAFVNVAKAVPLDPIFIKKTSASKKNVVVTSLFTDVPTNHTFFSSIDEAATRGIVSGNGKSQFRPGDLITVAEVVTMMVNSMGLNGLAPNPAAVTSFKDNDTIPAYARSSMYVAEKIGLIQEDAKGYIYPKAKVTKAKAADMMKAYIDYMSSDIREEYMDRILSY